MLSLEVELDWEGLNNWDRTGGVRWRRTANSQSLASPLHPFSRSVGLNPRDVKAQACNTVYSSIIKGASDDVQSTL